MTNEEAFFVVVGVDEPAGDSVGAVTDDFASLRFEDIDAFDAHLHFGVFQLFNLDVWLAEDDEEICRSGGL